MHVTSWHGSARREVCSKHHCTRARRASGMREIDGDAFQHAVVAKKARAPLLCLALHRGFAINGDAFLQCCTCTESEGAAAVRAGPGSSRRCSRRACTEPVLVRFDLPHGKRMSACKVREQLPPPREKVISGCR